MDSVAQMQLVLFATPLERLCMLWFFRILYLCFSVSDAISMINNLEVHHIPFLFFCLFYYYFL